MRILACGSTAVLVELADLAQTLAFDQRLQRALGQDGSRHGVTARIPAAQTILLHFDPRLTDPSRLAAWLRQLELEPSEPPAETAAAPELEIGVVYDGPDLDEVSRLTGLERGEVIRRHGATPWRVAFNGFAPGFAYLTGGDPALEVQRRATPRAAIAPGSVALAGRFSGIYPKASPGGWQLIGRSAAPLWDINRSPAALLQPGQTLRFVAEQRLYPSAALPPVAPPPATSQDAFTVTAALMPGLFQDLGRAALREQGIPTSGALDRDALIAANRCLGNPRALAAIEITGGGFGLTTNAAAEIAVTGAACQITVNGQVAPQQVIALDAGDQLMIGAPQAGLRSYLAVRGGFAVAPVLGSASRDLLSDLGPAPIVSGTVLGLARRRVDAVALPSVPAPRYALPRASDLITLEVILGPRSDWLSATELAAFCSREWRVTPQSNRIGLRLEGQALHRQDSRELPSEACVPGAVQLPHSGQPVLFLADHPTTGGYPVIAVVTQNHLTRLGQIPPGTRLRFQPLGDAAPLLPPLSKGP